MLEFSKTQMLLACGAELKAVTTVTTFPAIDCTALACTVPSVRITESVGLLAVVRPVASSRVMAVVVAAAMAPPRRAPDRRGSATSMICPGRTATALARFDVKLTASDSYRSVYKIHLPSLAAWPLLVQPMASTSTLTAP